MSVDIHPTAPAGTQTLRTGARHGRHTTRAWLAVGLAATAWFVWQAQSGSGLVNWSGFGTFGKFWTSSITPDVSGQYLQTIAWASIITLAFATLGTMLALGFGFVGGALMCGVWWRSVTGTRRRRHHVVFVVLRLLNAIPRGVHEAVWALFFVAVLGQDPLVGVLAIAIPFGAITAKMYADLIDSTDRTSYDNLRLMGAGRLVAFVYGMLPLALPDMVSYGFYRLECAVRSAVILGMIGAGGLGFELSLSFLALNYRQMWTVIYALIIISMLLDRWGQILRRNRSRLVLRTSVVVMAAATVASVLVLTPNLGSLTSPRTRMLGGDLLHQLFPLRLPLGVDGLLSQSAETFFMALSAIFIAAVCACPAAFLSVPPRGSSASPGAEFTKFVLVVARTIPLPVWALLFLFVLFPGPLPGIMALAIYNFGVVGRLFSEVVENLDQKPVEAIRGVGATKIGTFAYSVMPQAAPRFSAYTLYRWEIAIRETVVVGVVGAGGLGRLLEERRAAFDYGQMMTVAITLIVLSILVDALSVRIRTDLT